MCAACSLFLPLVLAANPLKIQCLMPSNSSSSFTLTTMITCVWLHFSASVKRSSWDMPFCTSLANRKELKICIRCRCSFSVSTMRCVIKRHLCAICLRMCMQLALDDALCSMRWCYTFCIPCMFVCLCAFARLLVKCNCVVWREIHRNSAHSSPEVDEAIIEELPWVQSLYVSQRQRHCIGVFIGVREYLRQLQRFLFIAAPTAPNLLSDTHNRCEHVAR